MSRPAPAENYGNVAEARGGSRVLRRSLGGDADDEQAPLSLDQLVTTNRWFHDAYLLLEPPEGLFRSLQREAANEHRIVGTLTGMFANCLVLPSSPHTDLEIELLILTTHKSR